jgi:hypothetical protein
MIEFKRSREVAALLIGTVIFANCTKTAPISSAPSSEQAKKTVAAKTGANGSSAPSAEEEDLKAPILTQSEPSADVVAAGNHSRKWSRGEVALLSASSVALTLAAANNMEAASLSVARAAGKTADRLEAYGQLKNRRMEIEKLQEFIKSDEKSMKKIGAEQGLFEKERSWSAKYARAQKLREEIAKIKASQVTIARAQKWKIGVSDSDREAFANRYAENDRKIGQLTENLKAAEQAEKSARSVFDTARAALLKAHGDRLAAYDYVSRTHLEMSVALNIEKKALETGMKSAAREMARNLSEVSREFAKLARNDGKVLLRGALVITGALTLWIALADGSEAQVRIHHDVANSNTNIAVAVKTPSGDIQRLGEKSIVYDYGHDSLKQSMTNLVPNPVLSGDSWTNVDWSKFGPNLDGK